MGGRELLRVGLIASVIVGVGCSTPADTVDPPGETEGDDGSCHPYSVCSECIASSLPRRSLDILVVVDGSIGAAGAQSRLAAGLEQLVAELDASENPLDYRIAVTTTDMGPPACDPSVTTPERGRFVASSCRERLVDFTDADGVDFRSVCTDGCGLEQIERVPTMVAGEAEPTLRAWFESDAGQLNLAADVDPLEALRCMAMVGVAGCRFESPLAAIEAALLGSDDPTSPNFGFFRPTSRWAFVIVSDAVDCSWTDVGLPIFDPAAERAFWSDPLASAPTPAVCWNAGTDCPSFDGVRACEPAGYDVHGDPTGWPDRVVLQPTTHFGDLVGNYNGHTDFVLFSGLALDGEVVYAEAEDPEFQLEHGIGPGCDDQAGTVALPPVRSLEFLREVRDLGDAEQYVAEHATSICAPDFGPPLAALGQRMRERLDVTSCYPHYPKPCDTDPSTALLDIDCEVRAAAYGGSWFDVPECARGDDGTYLVDPDTGRAAMPNTTPKTELCYLARVDTNASTADPLDDAWSECIEFGQPGFEIVTRDGRWPDLVIQPRCAQAMATPD